MADGQKGVSEGHRNAWDGEKKARKGGMQMEERSKCWEANETKKARLAAPWRAKINGGKSKKTDW